MGQRVLRLDPGLNTVALTLALGDCTGSLPLCFVIGAKSRALHVQENGRLDQCVGGQLGLAAAAASQAWFIPARIRHGEMFWTGSAPLAQLGVLVAALGVPLCSVNPILARSSSQRLSGGIPFHMPLCPHVSQLSVPDCMCCGSRHGPWVSQLPQN